MNPSSMGPLMGGVPPMMANTPPPPPPHGPLPPRMDNMMPTYFNKPPMAGMAQQLPQMHPPTQAPTLKSRVTSILRDKQRFLDMDENNAKRLLVEIVKGIMDEQGIASGT